MRVTNRLIASNLNRNIRQNLIQAARTQEQLATGKSMLRPSDQPGNMGPLLEVKASLSYFEQYKINLDDGLSYMNLSDSIMQTMGDILNQAAEIAIQGANSTYTKEDMAVLGEQIDKMIDHMVDLANSSVGGRYIFAGTQNSLPPLERVGDMIIYTGDLNGIYREVLSGEDYRIDAPGITSGYQVVPVVSSSAAMPEITQRQVPAKLVNTGIITVTRTDTEFTITNPTALDGVTPAPNLAADGFTAVGDVITINGPTSELEGLQIDMTGTAVGDQYKIVIDNKLGVYGHGTETAPGVYEVYNPAAPKDNAVDEGIFDGLFRLRDNLKSGNTAATDISIGEVRGKIGQLLQRRVGIGSRTRHFEALKDQILDVEVKMRDIQQKLEGADIYKLSINMAHEQIVYQASLASGANMMQVSLLNFLK